VRRCRPRHDLDGNHSGPLSVPDEFSLNVPIENSLIGV
jgi:hypothetical protein